MKYYKFLILLLNIMLCGYANSTPTTTNGSQLLSVCNDYIKTNGEYGMNTIMCKAYVSGVTDSLFAMLDIMLPKYDDCFFKRYAGITPDQVIRLTVNYLNSNPRDLNESGAFIIQNVIGKNFPVEESCYKKN